MVVKRKENDIAKGERELCEKKARESERLCNKYKRLLPTIRSHGKKSLKRHYNEVTSFQDASQWNPEPEKLQEMAGRCIQRIMERGAFRFYGEATELTTAAELGLIA